MKKLGIAASLVGLTLAGSGCHRAEAAPEPPRSTVPTTAVQVVKPLEKLEHAETAASGQIRSVREATLGARAAGTIARMRVEVGDRVKAGQALVDLDDDTAAANVALARAAVDAARSDLRLADLELERQKQLLAGNAATRAQLDRAEATRESAAAQVARAEASLTVAKKAHQDHRLLAPFDGVVTTRLKQAGESVSVATPLVALVDVANLEVRLDVPEAAVDGLRNGMAVTGTVSPSGLPFQAKVKAIGAAVDPKSRTVEVLLAIAPSKAAPQPGLRSGALVNVQLASAEALAGPFVPAKAVQSAPEGAFVWVVENGVTRRREVRGEAQGTELFRVRSGLSAKDSVVIAGVDRLKDGMAVRAVN
jgi:membrane fusion protein, multidrug efflux system